jgi:hypothetical protein
MSDSADGSSEHSMKSLESIAGPHKGQLSIIGNTKLR